MLISEIKPDVLHAHYVTDYGLMGALTNFHPFVVSVWGSDVLIAPKKSRISRCEASYTLRKADRITTTAEFMKDYLVSTFGLLQNRIARVPWGIDLKIFRRGYEKEVKALRGILEITADVPVILSNRHMTPTYNVERIVAAIPYVTRFHPDTVFIFIRGYASPEYENEVKLKAQKLGVSHNTRFVSRHISPREMAIYLNMADGFISIPKTDQFGSSVIEGMACGTVPIVSNIDVYHQYLENGVNALFVNPDISKDIAEKIAYCIEHPTIKDSFYSINRKIVEERENWDKNAKKMEEIYTQVVYTERRGHA
jgi:glycosyltransferase involved in cell wall biosynthesis